MSASHPSHLLALETGGNQAYVYRGPRLRESIGASALIAAAGTTWAREAAESLPVTTVVSTSGKAVLMGDRESLRTVLQAVTLRALTEAPGLDVAGGIVEIGEGGFFPALGAAFGKLALNRGGLRGAESRFQRLPIVDTCNSSGGPAAGVQRVRENSMTLGHEAFAKRAAADSGWQTMTSGVDKVRFARSIDRLDAELPGSWVAVVHADGCGMGQTFLAFDQHLRQHGLDQHLATVEASADAYRQLSTAVEQCTREAWKAAAIRVADEFGSPVDLVPVLLGGDDITVVAAGNIALPFAEAYLSEFTEITGRNSTLQALGVGAISAGAAVVWTKPSFPYRAAYGLAEERLKHAKAVARSVAELGAAPPSVVDVFVLYDSLIDTTERRTPDGQALLSGNPYALADHGSLPSIDVVKQGVTAVQGKAVASGQVHEIRSLLTTLGVPAAQRRLDELMVSHRKVHDLVAPLVQDFGERSLVTLLDVLDVADATGSVADSAAKEGAA